MSEGCIKLVALRINRCTRSSSQFQKGWWPLVSFNWWNKNAHPPRALISKHRSPFVQSPPRKAESRHEIKYSLKPDFLIETFRSFVP